VRKGFWTPVALTALVLSAGFGICSEGYAQTSTTTPPGARSPAGTPAGATTTTSTTTTTTRAPATTGAPRQVTTARSESVLRRPLADAPEGVQLGDFVLHGRIETDIEYDDNIYRTENNRISDGIVRLRPGITLQSQWDEHALDFYAQGEWGKYFQNSSEDYFAFALGTRGRYDIDEENQLNGLLEYTRSVLPRGSPGVGITPGAVTASVARVAFDYTHNGEPFYLRIGPRYEYRFYDGAGGSPADNHHYIDIGGRIGYRISEEVSVFLDPSYQFVKYVSVPDSTGFNRNSQGFDIRVGVTYDVTTEIGAEVAVGYFRRWYEDSRLLPDGGLSARVAVYWNPSEQLSFEIEGRRTLTEYRFPAGAGVGPIASGNAVETAVAARVGYLPLDNLLLDFGLIYARYDYSGIYRIDDYYGADIGLRYFFSPNFYLGPRYYHSRRSSTEPGQTYYDNRVMLTLGARM
jgi:hypothetical protein